MLILVKQLVFSIYQQNTQKKPHSCLLAQVPPRRPICPFVTMVTQTMLISFRGCNKIPEFATFQALPGLSRCQGSLLAAQFYPHWQAKRFPTLADDLFHEIL